MPMEVHKPLFLQRLPLKVEDKIPRHRLLPTHQKQGTCGLDPQRYEVLFEGGGGQGRGAQLLVLLGDCPKGG